MKTKLTFSTVVYSMLITMTALPAAPVWAAGDPSGCDTVACLSRQRNEARTPRFRPIPKIMEVKTPPTITEVTPSPRMEVDDRAIRSAVDIVNKSAADDAAAEEKAQSTESGLTCIDPNNCGENANLKYDVVARMQNAAAVINAISEKTAYQAEQCSAFADENGLNEFGKLALKELHDPLFKPFYDGGNPDIVRYCPNYTRDPRQGGMTPVQKDGLHLILLSGLSNAEASCNLKARLGKKSKKNPHGAPNGTAAGLFQLHLGHEDEYNGKVSEGKVATCVKNASKSARLSIRCVLGMATNRAIDREDWIVRHHFQVLDLNDEPRKGSKINEAHKIINNIKKYEFCKVPNNARINTAKN